MTRTDFEVEREYSDGRFSAVEVFRSEQLKVVCGYFRPGQFIPVHAPSSDVVIHIQRGNGLVRDGDVDHHVEAGDIVVVGANTERGVKAGDESELEALLVTSPPPTDADHDPVRTGLEQNRFEPEPPEA